MKTLILSLIASFALLTASAQFVLVNSPANIAGIYDYSPGLYDPDVTAGIWTADVAFILDNSEYPNCGCNEAINPAELNGKIVLVDRFGGCVLGAKLINAQNAGAIAVVIFNTQPGMGTVDILVSAYHASLLNIPAVMLSYEAGQAIRAELANGPVNMTIGQYKFPNDIGIGKSSVVNAPLGAMPAGQVTAGNFSLIPGANVANKGLNDAVNTTLTARVSHQELEGGPIVQVYEQSVSLDLIAAGDTGFIALPAYLPAEGAGVYYVDYQVASDSVEVPMADNQQSSKFILSEHTYCKGGWDFDNERPSVNNAYTDFGGGSIEFLSGFDLPYGEQVVLENIQFYVATGSFGPSFGAIGLENINGYVYEWSDANGDGHFNNNELEMVGIAPVANVDTSLNELWVTAPILELTNFEAGYHVSGNNKKYLVGLRYEGPEYVFFGFDEDYDQRAFVENGYATDLGLPYFVIRSWNGGLPDVEAGFVFSDVYASVAAALNISGGSVNAKEPSALATASVSLFPNPATDFLTVKLPGELHQQRIMVEMFNSLGVMVRQFEIDSLDFSAGHQVDISELLPGFYTLKTSSEGQIAGGKFLKVK
ncbi:MAG: T9SS type A sorting domain-containing protein [Lewinellaceae bacterium]|nr:T9SS type A sorting domain-containing protein [Lewinellaceae bacterium]